MIRSSRIVFFGSPDFAVPSLNALLRSKREVAAVVTQPDRPKGRGRRLAASPVKLAAQKFDLKVLQPEKINTSDFYQKMREISADFFIVAAFGKIFTEKLLRLPSNGAINVHASLLPKYRGAAPIQWAIINGEEETGVTTMFMEKKLDAGDILMTSKTPIYPDDDAGTLHDRLAEMGASLIVETLDKWEAGELFAKPQDHSAATYAPMLEKNHGRIDWTRSAEDIERFIRGMTPWPGAFTYLGEKRIKIFRAKPVPGVAGASPGSVIQGFENELRVAAGKCDAVSILELQSASGKRLKIEDFLKGAKIPPGANLS